MNAVLIGADILGNIPDLLASFNIRIREHISGRNAVHQRKLPSLPKGADIVILFTDFLGHNVMRHYRQAAKDSGTPIIACRRSATCLRQALTERLNIHNSAVEEDHHPCARCPRRQS